MRQKLLIVAGMLILIVVLIGLNAISYKQKETVPDSEANPNRSTYNVGATGTRAFFDLLNESGRRAVRWQQPPIDLRSAGRNTPGTLVIVGTTPREIDPIEARQILDWVATSGSKLVIIDRSPSLDLLKSDSNWTMSPSGETRAGFTLDPADPVAMTKNVEAGRAAQPTDLMRGVGAFQPSQLAAAVTVTYNGNFDDAFYHSDDEGRSRCPRRRRRDRPRSG